MFKKSQLKHKNLIKNRQTEKKYFCSFLITLYTEDLCSLWGWVHYIGLIDIPIALGVSLQGIEYYKGKSLREY